MPAVEQSRNSLKVIAEDDYQNGGLTSNGLKNANLDLKFSFPERQQSSKDDTLSWIKDEQESALSIDMDRIGSVETRLHISSSNEKIKHVTRHNGHFIPHSDTQVKEEIEIVKAYSNLVNSQMDQSTNLESILEISRLENQFNSVVKNMVTSVTNLKNKNDETKNSIRISGPSAPILAQKNLLHGRTAFEYLKTMNKLVKIHTLNSEDYYMFFREIDEYSSWMKADVESGEGMLGDLRWKKNPEINDADNFLAVIQEVTHLHNYWQNKLKELNCRSNHLIPVPQRLLQQKPNTRVICLADYKSKEALLKKSEELFLMSNSDDNIWKVKNFQGSVVQVPSCFVQIPGSVPEAQELLRKLKQEFLNHWTSLIKKSGLIFLAFLTTILKDWSPAEQEYIRSMSEESKEKMKNLLMNIRQLFFPFWKVHPIFQSVDEKMQNLEELLMQKPQTSSSQSEFEEIIAILLKNPETIDKLITQYEEFWTEWVTFKAEQEGGKVEKDGNNKRILQSALSLGTESEFSFSYDQVDAEFCGSEVYMIATAKETTESSQYSHSEQEERQTFVITGVMDPRDGTMVSLDTAVQQGIIHQEEGKYVKDLITGESIPIPLAMNSGFIKVELTRTKKSEEKRSELGLVTLHTHNEKRPFTIRAVRDSISSRQMSLEQAVRKGIVDQKRRIYRNKKTGEEMNFVDALDSGLIIAEFEESNGDSSPEEVVSKTYAIYEVLDTLAKKQLTFSKAVAKGILDQDTGVYVNRAKRENMSLSEAIKGGYIRATVVNDPKSFDMNYSPSESGNDSGNSGQNSPK